MNNLKKKIFLDRYAKESTRKISIRTTKTSKLVNLTIQWVKIKKKMD
jgi:hypothetical protein